MNLKRDYQGDLRHLVSKYFPKLIAYNVVQIVCIIPPSIHRIYYLIVGIENYHLMLFQTIFDSITGLLFAIVYGMNNSVRNELKILGSSLCRKKNENIEFDGSDDGDRKLYKTFISNNSF